MNLGEQCQTVFFRLPNESALYRFLADFHTVYRPVHTYLSIFICVLASACNICNIVILTRKPMRTPVNMILTAMACCDMVVLFSNLIFTTHWNFVAFDYCFARNWSYGWATFLISHAHLSLVGHSSSVWLSVMMALIRYVTLRCRGSNVSGQPIKLKHSYIAIALVVVFVATLNAPNFLTYKIIQLQLNETCIIEDTNITDPLAPAFIPGISEVALKADCLVFRMAFWISGTVFKLLPCALLTLLVGLLVKILAEVRKNRERLLRPVAVEQAKTNTAKAVKLNGGLDAAQSKRNHKNKSGGPHQTDRTTRMLLVIVSVCLMTELPQGIMAVLSGLFSEEFRREIYNHVGDVLDLLSLINSCTTFVIYCTMSAQFRKEFRVVFIPRRLIINFLRRGGASNTYCRPSSTSGGAGITMAAGKTQSTFLSIIKRKKNNNGKRSSAGQKKAKILDQKRQNEGNNHQTRETINPSLSSSFSSNNNNNNNNNFETTSNYSGYDRRNNEIVDCSVPMISLDKTQLCSNDSNNQFLILTNNNNIKNNNNNNPVVEEWTNSTAQITTDPTMMNADSSTAENFLTNNNLADEEQNAVDSGANTIKINDMEMPTEKTELLLTDYKNTDIQHD